jgi:chorismate mutase
MSDAGHLAPDQASPVHPELQRLRESIDNIDAALIHMLAERFKCTKQVGELKARHDLPPSDLTREAAQIERLRRLAASAHLDPDFAEKFLAFIIKEVIRHHESSRAAARADL